MPLWQERVSVVGDVVVLNVVDVMVVVFVIVTERVVIGVFWVDVTTVWNVVVYGEREVVVCVSVDEIVEVPVALLEVCVIVAVSVETDVVYSV